MSDNEKAVPKKVDVSIVIPTREEAANITLVLDELGAAMSASPYAYEVIIVDEHSKDKTDEIAARYPFVKVIYNTNGPGKGAALRCGFDIARGQYMVMMDADYSHDANDLPAMIETAKRTNGLVVGSRIYGGSAEYTPVRAFGNIMLTYLFGVCHGRFLSDALNGFKAFQRDIYDHFEYTSKAFEIEIELLANALRMGRTITEIPSHERARFGGVPKSSVIRHGTRFAWRILAERYRHPTVKRA